MDEEKKSDNCISLRRNQQILVEVNAEDCDLNKLRSLIWHGVNEKTRAVVWKLLIGYLPTSLSRREVTLDRKRTEYYHYKSQIYEARSEHQTEKHLIDMKQIDDDIPRTQSSVPIFKMAEVQEMLRRILYIWAIRHPSSGYVQGINDLCSVFLLVFMSPSCDFNTLTELGALPDRLIEIEADCYWCLSSVVDSVQDYFFPSSSGIQKALLKIQDIISRIDQSLVVHFREQQLEMMHFSFRWLNCMFIREFKLDLLFRLWDGFLSINDGFRVLSMYVAATLILKWKDKIKKDNFNEILLFLQNLPTDNWKEREIEEVLSQAYIYFSWFNGAPSHLKNNESY
jgi:TBC1 domain family member 2